MPGMNGTGPRGQGPGTGWGRGPCMGGGFGRGRGMGLGGRGFGPAAVSDSEATQSADIIDSLKSWIGRLEQRLDSLTEKLRNG